MKTKSAKLKKYLYKNRLVASIMIAVILFVGIYGGVMVQIKSSSIEASSSARTPKRTNVVTDQPIPVEPAPSDISSPEPQASSKPSPNSIEGEKARMKDPAYRAANLAPMAVTSVKTYGDNVLNCNIGARSLHTQYAVIMTNYAKGGTIKWQLEERQNGVINVLSAGVGSIGDLDGVYETPNLFSYGATGFNADSGIRVHVISPNDVASPWYAPTSCPEPHM